MCTGARCGRGGGAYSEWSVHSDGAVFQTAPYTGTVAALHDGSCLRVGEWQTLQGIGGDQTGAEVGGPEVPEPEDGEAWSEKRAQLLNENASFRM
jgi:hypothetical protein